MELSRGVGVINGADALFTRIAHLVTSADNATFVPDMTNTWSNTPRRTTNPDLAKRRQFRILFRPDALLQLELADHLHDLDRRGIEVRILPDPIAETFVIDNRTAIVGGETSVGERLFDVITYPTVVRRVRSLLDLAWRRAAPLAAYDARLPDIRAISPPILDALASGITDEAAARALGLSLRTYRRRVAELLTFLGATSRFQAGVRARDLGLI